MAYENPKRTFLEKVRDFFLNEYTFFIGGIILLIAVVYGLFLLKRWFNYEMSYESQVLQSLCEHIKPQSLIDPSICQ